MDAQSYTAALADLRGVRDEIKKARAALARLEAQRDKQIGLLATYDKAKAERIAPAAGLSLAEVVALVPALAPDGLAADTPETPPAVEAALATPDQPGDDTHLPAAEAPGAVAPAMSAPVQEAAPAQATPADARPRHAPAQPPADVPAEQGAPRTLPSIPDGTAGQGWFTHTANLLSQRPNFTQQARATVFLDTDTGVLVHRNQTHRLSLGAGTAAEILTAVFHAVPEGAERIYITAGDPWHRDAGRYPYLRDAVAAWLNAPTPGWRTDTGRGRDRMAGHFVHARHPVGRYQRENADSHVEIRSVGEWFDVDGDDPATVRDAFVLLWQALRRHWSDAVVMGSPSQTGRDLWTRTIPQRGQYAEGYPVLSEELRGLLHATAGQGRTELILPPRVPEQLPQLVEYDRTFAYAKHTWKSPVGTPAASPRPPSPPGRRRNRCAPCTDADTGRCASPSPTPGSMSASCPPPPPATAPGTTRTRRAPRSPPGPADPKSTPPWPTPSPRGRSRSSTASCGRTANRSTTGPKDSRRPGPTSLPRPTSRAPASSPAPPTSPPALYAPSCSTESAPSPSAPAWSPAPPPHLGT